MPAPASILAGAEPFRSPASVGSVGVLLSHGFTGSPASMLPWAKTLEQQGYQVRVPLLPGHGTRWQDLNASNWHQWYDALEREFLDLRANSKQIVVCGLSMGGALSLRLAAMHPESIDALVLVNPAIASRDLRLRLIALLKWFVPSIRSIGDDIAKPGVNEVAYDRTPLRAVDSMRGLWTDVIGRLSDVTTALLYLHSPNDHVVDDASLRLIRAKVRSAHFEYLQLPRSYHVATLDYDRELIETESARFIAKHTRTRSGDRDG